MLNPSGVLFTPTAQVDVGGLLASTLTMRTEDFLAGRYRLSGDSTATVSNQGEIRAADGGTVALIAATVQNTGGIAADRGNVLLGAGSDVTLDVGGPVKLRIDRGLLNSLIENGGAIRADGGTVLLTSQALNQVSQAVINNSGVIRARSLVTGETGEIQLLGDMHHGALQVGGTLDASAPAGGHGGRIETSAAAVATAPGLVVDASSRQGQAGSWLIDPYDYTINAAAANTIATTLNGGTSVTVSTQSNTAAYGSAGGTGTASGDITVASAITMTGTPTSTPTLTLQADRNIIVNSSITSTGGPLNLTLSAANNSASTVGGVQIAGTTTLNSAGGKILIGGAGGSIASAQTSTNGIGYALNFDSSHEAVSVGAGAQILSGGGNITINGYSTQPKSGSNDTTAVHIGGSALIDSGYYGGASSASSGGYINLTGRYVGGVGGNSNTVFGVKIDNPSGNSGQTTITSSTSSGGIRVNGYSSYDAAGSYALNMATNGLAGNIYFAAYSVADLIFLLNDSLKGVNFTYGPPSSGCRTGYPYCGTLGIVSSANNSYLYATYNAVNSAVLPIYVSATLSGTKVYDGTQTATGLNFTNVQVLDPNGSGYTASNVTSASYITRSANVGSYSNLTQTSQARNYTANNKTYVIGYNFTVSPSYTITPATASLSATKTYDGNGTLLNTQVTASGVNGETLSLSGTGSPTANSSAVADNGSNYLTSLSGLSLANGSSGTTGLSSNYVLPSLTAYSANNTVTINPVGLTVLGQSGSKVYDGTATFNFGQLSLGGVHNNDDVHIAGSATVSSANVGSYTHWSSSNLSLNGSAAANYTLNGGNVTATITKAPLGLDVSAVYNGSTTLSADGTATLSKSNAVIEANGLVGSERITSLTISQANVASNGSNTIVSATGSNGFSLGNYQIGNSQNMANGNAFAGNQTGAATSTNAVWLKPAPLGVSVSGTYNGSTTLTTAGGATITGYGLVGQDANVALTSATLSSANVATGSNRVVSVTGNGSFAASNYVLNGGYQAGGATAGSAVDGTGATNAASLSQASLTVTPASLSKVYGSNDPTLTYTATGLIGGDTLSGSLTRATGETVAGGPYAIQIGSLANPNYNIHFGSGALTITPASLNVTPASLSKVYGSNDPTLTYTATGLIGGDALSGSLARAAGETVAGGPYAIQIGSLANPNYSIHLGNAALTITPASLNVTPASLSKVYGSNDPALTYTATGLIGGDTLSGSLARATGETVAGGPYAIQIGSLANPNYSIHLGNAALTITPATLTYVATPVSVAVGTAPGTLGGSLRGFVYGDTQASATSGSLVFSTAANASSPVGNYAMTGAGLSAANYVFAQAVGNQTAYTVTAVQAAQPVQPAQPAAQTTSAPPAQQFMPQPANVPAFADNANAAIGNQLQPPGFGGLNYVPAQANGGAGAPTLVVGPLAGGASAITDLPGVDATALPGSSATRADGSATPRAEASSRRLFDANAADISVPSARGPLDVIVVNGGVRSPANEVRVTSSAN